MKKFLLGALVSACCLFSSGFALGQDVAPSKDLAVGVAVGSNDGISVLYSYAPDEALQGGISIGKGFSRTSLDWLSLHPEAFKSNVVVPYVGVGGFYAHNELEGKDAENVGVRIPFGLMVNVPETPVQFAVELAPTMEVDPKVENYVDSMIGFRLAL